jgi:hypothetical protein
LQAAVAGANGGFFDPMPRYWKWVGDFYLLGEPFNIIVSVKSFAAKERLLASGSGNLLSPTVGWGLFTRPQEFSYARLVSYAYRGFAAIYAPAALIQALPAEATAFTNINGHPLMRDLAAFVADIQHTMGENHRVNPRLL